MATDDETSPDALAPEEARRQLVRLITRHDIEKHRSLYEELERE
jgi:hypothetical protein